ncbi:TadE/TadG family type IV pilus assembly protein [Emcibacter sp. SYSU 3D8]|uniref:TadE/TadG family type IV pilus assembly protein n=1 Tax=Emcibacter sp. SYSU 3D8 TaxID=3133969 RepID=UPI0031FE61DD
MNIFDITDLYLQYVPLLDINMTYLRHKYEDKKVRCAAGVMVAGVGADYRVTARSPAPLRNRDSGEHQRGLGIRPLCADRSIRSTWIQTKRTAPGVTTVIGNRLKMDTMTMILGSLPAMLRDRRGNIAIIVALCLPILLSTMALGFEVGQWHMTKWAMQNTADSAVLAAATNGGANYDTEAKAVAAQYGFTHGANNVTVTATNTATCPSGGNTCYKVTITKPQELYLSQMVGFQGSTAINGQRMQNLASSATARQAFAPREYCILALASSGATNGIRTNGAPKASLPGCDIMSNTNATCNGSDLTVDIGDAAGTNSGCGTEQNSHMPVVSDPFAALATNIPSDPCGASYPQKPSLPSSNQWTGSKNLSGDVIICGDLQLTGNVTIDAPDGAVLVIFNGQLDTQSYTLRSTNGSALTIVFAGDNGVYTHAPTGNGMLDFAAPTTGVWKGVAIYQAPNLTTGVDVAEAGNSPAWKVTGMVYMPRSSVTLKGIVNKASYGYSCFGLIVDNLTFSGTNAILAQGECDMAGLDLPYNSVADRGQLVD